MANIKRFLTRNISTDAFDIKCGQSLCFAGGPLILALGGYKFNTFDLTASQIFCGVLLLSALAMLMVIMGLLLPVTHAAAKTKSE